MYKMPLDQRVFTMKKGFTLVEVLMVVAIITLLTAVAIPNILRSKIIANDALAQASLRNIATALESYYHTNHEYPATVDDLTNLTPPYLTKDYFSTTQAGFIYAVPTLTSVSYTVTASPLIPNVTGSITYTVTTGGVLQ